MVLIKLRISVIVCWLAELKPALVVTDVPVFPSPDPVVVFVTEIGAIKTVPPKLTIPPEIVPIFTPSLFKSKSTAPPPCPDIIVYVQAVGFV